MKYEDLTDKEKQFADLTEEIIEDLAFGKFIEFNKKIPIFIKQDKELSKVIEKVYTSGYKKCFLDIMKHSIDNDDMMIALNDYINYLDEHR